MRRLFLLTATTPAANWELSMIRATLTTGRKTVLLSAYSDSRGTQYEVIVEHWNAKRTGCSRSVFMTAKRREAFQAFRNA